jgi:DNA segregation ATPase FtsK/SpoIIIE-like protein
MKKRLYDPSRFPPIQDHGLKISIGIFLVLFTLLGFLNQAFVSGVISLVFGFFIGDLRFLGYLLILFYGVRLIANRSFIRIKPSLTLTGILFILLSTLGLFTIEAFRNQDIQTTLTFSNVFSVFFDQFPPLTPLPPDFSNLAVGGGVLGYVVVTLLNLIGLPQFNSIFLITLLVIGVMLGLEFVWLKLFTSLNATYESQQKDKEFFKKVSTLKPKQLNQQIVSEVSKDNGEITSYRSMFPTQTIVGLERVSFRKPSSGQIQTSPLPSPNQPIVERPSIAPTFESPSTKSSFQIPLTTSLPSVEEEDFTEEVEVPLGSNSFNKPILQSSLRSTNSPPPMVSQAPESKQKEDLPYQKPSLDLLETRLSADDYAFNDVATQRRVQILQQKFESLGVEAEVVGYQIGPSVTSFDIQMREGSQTQQVKKVVRDLGIAIGGYEPIFKEIVPGRAVSSLEVLNERAAMVGFKEMIIDLRKLPYHGKKLSIPFGRNMIGEVVSFTPKDMIHLLVAGSSGSGKTVFVHSFISSILLETTPDQAKILLIDPKKFELNKYKDLPHLLCPIISDVSEAKVALERLIDEMEDRYQQLLDSNTSSLDQFNQYAINHGDKALPLIFAIIDEYNDLINTNPQVSELVQRLAQKSRAAGIHLLIATQRPTTDIITGSIKNNLATIVALRVSKQVDSVTVLGHAGAEILGGNGDMYLVNPLFARFGEIRVQGAYISDEEITRITSTIRSAYPAHYDERFLNLADKPSFYQGQSTESYQEGATDPLYQTIKAAALSMDYVSMSWISRVYKTGYPRALKIFKQLQIDKIIDDSSENNNNNKGRRVLGKLGDTE